MGGKYVGEDGDVLSRGIRVGSVTPMLLSWLAVVTDSGVVPVMGASSPFLTADMSAERHFIVCMSSSSHSVSDPATELG